MACFVIVSCSRIEHKGNFSSTGVAPIRCLNVRALNNKYTPVDLYPSAVICIQESNYSSAFGLFSMAGAYGSFDSLRVTDVSAHQAYKVAMINSMSVLSAEKRDDWKYYIKEQAPKSGSEKSNQICNAIKEIGYPKYDPDYMIQHGMNVLTGKNTNPLNPEFNPDEAWGKILKEYLDCPVAS